MKVRFTLDGAERYDTILAYLRLQSSSAADRLVGAVDRAFRRLGSSPSAARGCMSSLIYR